MTAIPTDYTTVDVLTEIANADQHEGGSYMRALAVGLLVLIQAVDAAGSNIAQAIDAR